MAGSDARAEFDRRRFLKRGLFGGTLLVLGGSLPFVFRTTRRGEPPRGPLRLLSADEYAVLAAIAARIVPGDGADARWPRAAALDCAGKVDALMATVHPDVGHDFRRLLRLCESGFVGTFTGGLASPVHARVGGRAGCAARGLAPLASRHPAQRLPGAQTSG